MKRALLQAGPQTVNFKNPEVGRKGSEDASSGQNPLGTVFRAAWLLGRIPPRSAVLDLALRLNRSRGSQEEGVVVAESIVRRWGRASIPRDVHPKSVGFL